MPEENIELDVGNGDNSGQTVLNRDEINDILNETTLGQHKFGMEQLIHGGIISYERLPMLEVIYDRLVRILSTSLRNLTQDNVDVTLQSVKSKRFGECLGSSQGPGMFAIFDAKEWDNFGILFIEQVMISNIVDVMMGGRRQSTEIYEEINFTSIERNLVERLVHLILNDLEASFSPVCKVSFRFVRIETDPRFAMVARFSSASIFAQIGIMIGSRQGRIDIVLPYATIEPVRDLLLQQFMGEKFGRDTIWESHLAEELRQTTVDLDIILDEQVMDLGVLINAKKGDVLPLKFQQSNPITVRCGSEALFEARLSAKSNQLAAVISKVI
jgi:flagellar motor switch protein FliM